MRPDRRPMTVRLFRGTERQSSYSVTLGELISVALRPALVGRTSGKCQIHLQLRSTPGADELLGRVRLINLSSHYGYVDVRVNQGDSVVYHHPHSVNELLGPLLLELVGRLDPDEGLWAFDLYPLDPLDPLRSEEPERRPPDVDGSVEIDMGRPRPLRFGVRRSEEPELPVFDAEAWDVDSALMTEEVTVLVEPEAAAALGHGLDFSRDMEEGGFLAGRPYLHPDGSGRFVVVVEHVLPARRSGASVMHFTFTGDSFREMSLDLASRHPGSRLVGWYHTHLFPANDRFGLSRIDVNLHLDTFQRPWQVAALINLTDRSRVLRCYARGGEEMVACPLGSPDERHGRIRFATAGKSLR